MTRSKSYVSDLQVYWRVYAIGSDKGQNSRVGSPVQYELENSTMKVRVGVEMNSTILKKFRSKMGHKVAY